MTEADTLEALLGRRHSCRAFLDRPVERATVERLLGIAQRTPSWCNAQPWQVTVLSGDATRRFAEALSRHAASAAAEEPDIAFPAAYEGVYGDRRRACAFGLYDALGIARGDRERRAAQMRENFRLFGAPHFALITADAALGPYGVADCGGYVSTFLAAAEALGLAAVPQAAVASYSPWLHEHLALPRGRLVVCGISFGHPDREHPANAFRTERASLAEAVDWRD